MDVLKTNLHKVGQLDVLKGGGEPVGPGQSQSEKFKPLGGGLMHVMSVHGSFQSGAGVRTIWITSPP